MSRIQNSLTIVCYDITSNKLRRKIDKCMKDFGQRLQFSVFLCRMDASNVVLMRDSLSKVLSQYYDETVPNDSLIIFERFSPDTATTLLGVRIPHTPSAFGII